MAGRGLRVWAGLVVWVGCLALGAWGNGSISMLVYDEKSREFVCGIVQCANRKVLPACGYVPGVGVALSSGNLPNKCVTQNECDARDLLVMRMASNESKGIDYADSIVNAVSQPCADSGFNMRMNAAIVVGDDREVSVGRYTGALVARSNASRLLNENEGENHIHAVILSENGTDDGLTFRPLDYWREAEGRDSSIPLAVRATSALFVGLDNNNGLSDCLAGSEDENTGLFASAAMLAYGFGPAQDQFFAIDIEGESISSLERRTRAQVRTCTESNCIDDKNFGSPDKLSSENLADRCTNECFPANALVELEDGRSIRLADLKVGDKVLTSEGVYSKVFSFSHRVEEGWFKFVRLQSESGRTLSLSRGHYLYVDGRMKAAELVQVGDFVELSSGQREVVTSVEITVEEGLINPHTQNGDVVVNEIRCSTFTTAVDPRLARLLLLPLRLSYELFGLELSLKRPGAWLASLVPGGKLNY